MKMMKTKTTDEMEAGWESPVIALLIAAACLIVALLVFVTTVTFVHKNPLATALQGFGFTLAMVALHFMWAYEQDRREYIADNCFTHKKDQRDYTTASLVSLIAVFLWALGDVAALTYVVVHHYWWATFSWVLAFGAALSLVWHYWHTWKYAKYLVSLNDYPGSLKPEHIISEP